MALTQVPSVMIDRPLVTIASASTVNIGASASDNISVTGTTTITAFDTVAAGAVRTVTFAGALTLTHNATTLILPGATNITTAAGDVADFQSLGSGNWRCINYVKANGTPVVTPASAFAGLSGQVFTSSGTFTVPAGVTAVKVTMIGAGGGGGGSTGANGTINIASSGGSAAASFKYVTGLTPGGTVAVTVGAGGTAGASSGGNGGAGGTTSFGAYLSITGGGGGLGVSGQRSGSNYSLAGGAAGVATGGDFTYAGVAAGNSGNGYVNMCTGDIWYQSSGANIALGYGNAFGFYGFGGVTQYSGSPNGSAGNSATGYGSGGCGAMHSTSGSFVGGTGSQGIVIVEW